MDPLTQGLKTALWYVVVIPTILVVALLAEQIPLLHELDVFFARDRPFWVGLTGGMAVVGVLVLLGAQFVIRRPTAEELREEALGEDVRATFSPMSPGEVEDMIAAQRTLAAWPFIWWHFRYCLFGRSAGQAFEVEAPMRAVKQAWRSGAWRHHPVWQLFFVMAAGAILMVVGLFGMPIVLPGPPLVKLICGGGLLYATLRTAWAFRQA